MKSICKFRALLAPLAVSLAVFPVLTSSAQTLGGSAYTNSWIGNTYGTPADHIAHNIDNLYVTPSGKIATITEWDEGGHNAALYNSSGGKIGIPVQSGTGSWGRNSGMAVFVNDNYLYQSMRQNGGYDADGVRYPVDPNTSWKAIRRYNHDGSAAPFPGGKGYDGSMLVVNEGTSELTPTGVLVLNNELYVSDPIVGLIKVYNASTMAQTPVRTFAIANAGLLDHDRLGFIWMLDTVQKKLIRFSTTGSIQSQSITFPSGVVPTSFCVDKTNDRILVANNGNNQNVLIYTSIFGTPAQTSTFGNTGGINSGTPGAIAPLKFSEPKGVGIDSSGNIIVGSNGVSAGGGRLEKYNSSGVLQWRLNGTIFTANGSLNPSDETEFYTHEHKFGLNLGNTTPGTEWSLVAQTVNKVKYPNDQRVPVPGGNNYFWTTTYMRHLSGKKLMYISDMYGSGLGIYRFNATTDGENAIPSGHFSSGHTWQAIWRDSNGNGSSDSGETASQSADNSFSTHIVPDTNGGVWKANREQGIRYFPLQGFDTHGNPQSPFASSTVYTTPEIVDVKRLEYDALNNVLYVAGRSTQAVTDHWWAAGDRLTRYNNFTGTRSTAWSIPLPYGTNADLFVKAFCEEGDYLFLGAAREGRIYVHQKSDGSKVGEILPTAATGNTSGWFDFNGAVRATRRSNGEYLIFAEENGFGKIMMYRWTPPSIGAGTITRDVWTGINGTSVSAIPTGLAPTSTGTLTSFEAPTNVGDNYGQRVRGYITAPASGSYTFWIAGDDNCELWLSTNNNPASKVRIASHTEWTNSREWNKYASQKSSAISLNAGQKYYVEALMKEGLGGDNLAVGWARPGQGTSAPSEVIPGNVLAPYTVSSSSIVNGGIYELEPVCAPGKRLEVSGAGSADGANVHIWTDFNAGNQRWKAELQADGRYELTPQHALNKRLDVNGSSSADGANVHSWTDNNSTAQRWTVMAQSDGTYELEPACAPGKRLNVNGAGSANGTNVNSWTDNDSPSQRWRFFLQ